MSIKKQFLKSKEACKVTWIIDKNTAGAAKKITLVGDFNGWNEHKAAFSALKNGTFKYVTELPKNNSYQFRYLVDNQHWMNEAEADGFVDNLVSGEQNCIISL
ncbi:isoamylase early set domain-containing protein [Reichenbachiella carrageenanivorans]|uniref:Isoamylase early set domain-containing protein n=1 Tax=Reichenbachiella carrageenanivorans TaxID=2979869 RepID=A0ABY6D1E0_9BACT|nr:isoamylase early set domain-containing protein [Reichenbachiella carrageenanivorans]UXX79734.1 isoamylase early set domain-containing protein [Reichenbachiella carrageenanivorans]